MSGPSWTWSFGNDPQPRLTASEYAAEMLSTSAFDPSSRAPSRADVALPDVGTIACATCGADLPVLRSTRDVRFRCANCHYDVRIGLDSPWAAPFLAAEV